MIKLDVSDRVGISLDNEGSIEFQGYSTRSQEEELRLINTAQAANEENLRGLKERADCGDEEARLEVEAVIRRSKDALQDLITGYQKALWRLTFNVKFDDRKLDRADLYQQSVIFFVSLVMRFDGSRGIRLSTYLWIVIPRRLWYWVAANSHLIRTPTRSRELTTDKAKENYSRAINCQVGLPEFDYVLPISSTYKTSRVELEEEKKVLWEIISSLEDRSQTIISGRLKGESLQSIGVQLGISKERVRQLEAKIVRKLSEEMYAAFTEKWQRLEGEENV